MENIRLLIFDLDGTLADTLDGITEGLNRTMAEAGYPLHNRDSVLSFVNYGTRRYIEEALPANRREDVAEVTRLMGVYNRHYADTYTLTRLYPGIMDLVTRLQGKYLLAINSNKQDEFVKVLAKQLFPEGLFFAAEGFRDDRPAKPHPGMAHAIMDMASAVLGETLTPENCIYIGDSDIDIYTAQNAGMHGISVSWGYRSHDFLTQITQNPVCATPAQVLEVLEEYEGYEEYENIIVAE